MNDEGNIFAGPRPGVSNASKGRATRYTHQPTGRRWLLKLSLGLVLVCALVYGWVKLTDPQTLPIHSVKITGSYSHVNPTALRETIMPFLQKGFLTVDTKDLQDRLQQLPWVYSVSVQRVWPDTLTISLVEQQALARYNDNALLNQYGELFSADSTAMAADLPLFVAPPGQQVLVWQTYQKLTTLLAPLGMKITILGLDARQSWRLQLSNGLVLLLGTTDPEQRLIRFVKAYPQVMGSKSAAVSYVDLRYANGMAVGLKQ